MTNQTPTQTQNRLAKETSPYLLQHQNNPVDWYPWGEEALARSEAEDKPILLSIGYSACHWCHVMEKECFENPEIARLMNENFINIKVDREERPDLDHIYQNVAQAISRGGGWPLTVFLTPALRPFFGGTYFPPEDRYGRPGFARVLKALSNAYRKDVMSVAENARKLTEYIQRKENAEGSEPQKLEMAHLSSISREMLSYVDWTHGGVGGAPKFPNSTSFSFLWRLGNATQAEGVREVTLITLSRMAAGGIYDQLGGGFHRYSVDESWSVPHFEKMLYDNALLLSLYSEVLLTEGAFVKPEDRDLYFGVLKGTVEYVLDEMTSPEGGFYSAEDADSEGEEGKYYVWTAEELSSLLTSDENRVFSLRYGVTPSGNFEHGATVLYLNRNEEEIQAETQLSKDQVQSLLESARAKLFVARKKRIAPLKDTKILTSWNALMISGLIWAARALSLEEKYHTVAAEAEQAAVRAFEFLVKTASASEDRLFSTIQNGKGKGNGFLDDYAFLAKSALDLSRFTKNSKDCERYLRFAQKWIEVILRSFRDPKQAGYFFTSDDHEPLIHRPKTYLDSSVPSGTAVALYCLSALAEIDLDNQGARYATEFEFQVNSLLGTFGKNTFGTGELLSAGLLALLGPVVISGPTAAELSGNHPHLFQKPYRDVVKGLVVCHQKSCSLPLEGREDAEKFLKVKLGIL